MHLEAINLRAVPVRLERNRRSTDILPSTLRNLALVPRSPAVTRVASSVPARASCIARAALRRYKRGVDKEEEVGEGRAEVGSIDGAVAG